MSCLDCHPEERSDEGPTVLEHLPVKDDRSFAQPALESPERSEGDEGLRMTA